MSYIISSGEVSSGIILNYDSMTVLNGGKLYISSGGTATEITENGRYVSFDNGANVTFTPNTFSALVLSDASATVHSGTTANSTTVNGGHLYVYSGGKMTGRVFCTAIRGNSNKYHHYTSVFFSVLSSRSTEKKPKKLSKRPRTIILAMYGKSL